MNNAKPYVRPYAHIFFCEDIIKGSDGHQMEVIGQFSSHLLRLTVLPPLVIPQLVIGVQLVIAKTDRLESLRLLVKWRDKLLMETQFDDELRQLSRTSSLRDPETTRNAISMDFKLNQIEVDQDGELLVEVLLNGEPLNHNALRFRFIPGGADESRSTAASQKSEHSTARGRPKPSIPSLLLIPDQEVDGNALFAIAVAYADAGLLVSAHGKTHEQMAFTFPAIVCSSFAIELFLKFFAVLAQHGVEAKSRKYPTGHRLTDLWEKISPAHQRVIAGMFRNSTGQPLFTGADLRIERFLQALREIGDSPFMKWRYAYELDEISMMSHGVVAEVLDALGHAAQYVRLDEGLSLNT